MKKFLAKMKKDEKGQGLVEYALIIALVAVVCIAFFPQITAAINGIFGDIAAALNGA